MKHKIFTLLAFCFMTANIYAIVINGINYELEKHTINGSERVWYTAEVVHNPAYSGDMIIPSSISYLGNKYDVTSICGGTHGAFENCTNLESIIIPETVTSIGSFVFHNCTNLKSVTIPETITSIGERAFDGCSSLASIEIPNSVTFIGDYAFNACTSLRSVNISDLESWCALEFSNKTANPLLYASNLYLDDELITHLVIPESVTSIKSYAFEGCTSLTSVEIPNSVTPIGSYAFEGCTSLTSVEIPNSVTSIGSYAFSDCRSLTSVTIPESVTSIGSYAFKGCKGLTSIEIPNSVTSIGAGAFASCSAITSVEIPNSVTSIGAYAFSGCTGITSLFIPESVTTIGTDAFKNVNNIVYSGTAKTSPWGAKNAIADVVTEGFLLYEDSTKTKVIACSSLATGEINIPESVTAIKTDAFSGCVSISSIYIPTSVTSIGSNAFKDVNNITYMNGKNGSAYGARNVNKYVDGLFVYADATKNQLLSCLLSASGGIIVPQAVTSIGSNAFDGCKGLTSIEIPNSVTSIGSYAFNGCTGLTSVEIPNSVTSIGSYAFNGCTGLTSITIGSSVTSIGSHAFDACNGLTSIEIPNSVTSIETEAFSGCTSLSKIEIPNSVTSIGSYAFYGCSSLKSVTLPDTLRKIESKVFSCCYNLTLINIPDSVTSIGKEAFAYCYNLPTLVIPSKVASIYSDAFKNVRIVKYDGNATGAPWGAINVLTDVISDEYLIYSDASKSKILSCIPEVKGHLDIPSTVTSIGAKAFYQCNDLTSVHIPNSVLSISKNAFSECKNLKTVVLNSDSIAKKNYTWSATASGRFTLEDVFGTQVNEFIMGDSVKSIGNNAFKSYDDLVSIKMSDSVTTIGAGAFDNCQNLAYVKLSNSLKTIGEEAFRSCNSLQGICIPDSVTSLSEGYIFYGAQLTYLIIGKSVKKISGTSAFCNTTQLQYIISCPITPPSCSSGVFGGTNSFYSIPLYVPKESISAYSSATIWKNFKNIFPIIKAEEVFVEDVRTNPSEASVELAWPIVDNSLHYMIEIREGEELVNQLIVNAEGYVLNKMNAPSKYQQSNNFTTNGLQCTISELKPGTTYNYTITALTNFDLSPEPLQGFFTTTGTATDIDEITNDQSSVINKVMINGQVLILRGDKTYTLTGQEVK